MKPQIEQLLLTAVNRLANEGALPDAPDKDMVTVGRARDPKHGDFATSVALRLAKSAHRNPHELAQAVIAALPPNPLVARAEVAGGGFINFFLTPAAFAQELARIHEQGVTYGSGTGSDSASMNLVSAEPTMYNIRYAHARVSSLMKQLEARGFELDLQDGLANSARLASETEQTLLKIVTRYPEALDHAIVNRAPQSLVRYLHELAHALHTYNKTAQIIVAEVSLRNARLALVLAVQQVIRNGLTLVGVSAPETM